MTKEIAQNKTGAFLKSLDSFIKQTGLKDAKTIFNSKTGTISVIGSRDGYCYTTTIKKEATGIIKTESAFKTNIGKNALINQIKVLLKQGYKQQEIADMLNISQSLVSKYSRL